ncbi:MAG: type IV pilus biogenesis/stability protein PilW [Methylococcaceae bacterium]|nr:type IV pilus biogenesis/stability protein PilW [Methylococcaceae bacterium]
MRKKPVYCLAILLVTLFMSACTNTREPMPKKEEAILYMQMGVRYMEMGMLKIAKENLEMAVDIDSNNADVHNALGVLYERLQMVSKAMEQYREAVAIDASSSGAKNNYGRFLCEKGDYEAGMQMLNETILLPLNNRKWFAYTNLGRCQLKHGDQKLAEYSFRKALQINKKYSPALLEMQKISYHSKKYMSARAFLERYLSVAKHTAQSLWYAVQTERVLGNKQLAEAYKDKLFSLFPVSKEAQQLNIDVK